jgi:hypothetical protein
MPNHVFDGPARVNSADVLSVSRELWDKAQLLLNRFPLGAVAARRFISALQIYYQLVDRTPESGVAPELPTRIIHDWRGIRALFAEAPSGATVMQLRTHPKMELEGFSNWPPMWAGSYRPGDILPVGEERVLKDVNMTEADNTMPRHLTLMVEHRATAHQACSAVTRRRSSLGSTRF